MIIKNFQKEIYFLAYVEVGRSYVQIHISYNLVVRSHKRTSSNKPPLSFETGKSVWGNVACVRARMLKRSCSRKESFEFSKRKKNSKARVDYVFSFVSMRERFFLFAFSDLFFLLFERSYKHKTFSSLSLFLIGLLPNIYNWRLEGKAIHFFLKDLLVNDVPLIKWPEE